jgi:hypothetical protein
VESRVHDTHATRREPASNGPRHACPVYSPKWVLADDIDIAIKRCADAPATRKAEGTLPEQPNCYLAFDTSRPTTGLLYLPWWPVIPLAFGGRESRLGAL